MDQQSRAARITALFVTLADTLVQDFDPVDLLQTLVEESAALLGAAEAGLVIATADAQAEMLASTSQDSGVIEVIQWRTGSGPCGESYLTGQQISVPGISETGARWPDFAAAALAKGFRSVHSVPLTIRGESVDAFNLFRHGTGALDQLDADLARGFADVATLSILQDRSTKAMAEVNSQLQQALDSRVLIEQAKGALAQSKRVDTQEAFRLLREYARSNSTNLTDVSQAVLSGTLTL